jgi:hypothetical protein
MHGACLLSWYTQSVVNWTDGHQADGKAFGCGIDSAFKSALLQRLVVVLSKSVSFMKITHTTQQVNATDTNIFILIVFHSVFSKTRLKCEPSNEYENWTRCFVKNCQRIWNIVRATGHRFENRLENEICLKWQTGSFSVQKSISLFTTTFGKERREKIELPVSANIMPRKLIEKGKIRSSPFLPTAVCEVNQSLEGYDVTPHAFLLGALIW